MSHMIVSTSNQGHLRPDSLRSQTGFKIPRSDSDSPTQPLSLNCFILGDDPDRSGTYV